MWRLSIIALALAALLSGEAASVELKNLRMAHGDFGITRTDKKFLPGDVLFLTYDVDGLGVADKGTLSFETVLEIFDGNKKLVRSKNYPPTEIIPPLGGNRIPAKLTLNMGVDQKPGDYIVKVTVTDRVGKKSAEFSHRIELLPEGFGAVLVQAPAIGYIGSTYPIMFSLVHSPLDKKTKLPSIDVTMRVFEEGGKTELSKPVTTNLPAILPDEFDPKTIPLNFGINLTRPGRFVAELEVNEKLGNHKLKMLLPFTVLELK
jgi:hypothetical protein